VAKPVTIRILGDASGLTGTLDRASSKLGSFGAAAGVAAGAAAAAVGAFGVSSVKKFSEFETGMAEVFTLMPGLSEDAMSAMEDQVLDLSNQMGILPQDAIPALYDAISAGVPTDNVFQFMEDASKLAIGGSIDAGEAVDVLSTSVNAWSESNLSAADASDFLFTTVKLGKTTMAELNSSLAQVAPIASAIGVGLDEVGASVAVLTANGMSTSQAATGLKAALSELGKEGTKASDAFKELNDGATFTEFLEAGGTLEEAMVMIADSGESVIDMFGSVEAGGAVLSLTAGDAEQLSANMAAMADSSGAAGEAFEMMDGTTGRSMDRIKAKLEVVQIQLGDKLLPIVETVIAFVEDNWPKVSAAFELVSGIVTEHVIPVIVETIEWLRGRIEAFIAVVTDAWEKWGDSILEAVQPIWDAIKMKIDGALQIITGVFNTFKALFEGDWSAMWDGIVDVLSGIWTTIKATFLLGWEAVKLSFKMVWESIKIMATAAFGKIVDGIKALPGLLLDGLKAGGQLLLDAGSWMGDKIMDGLVAALKFVGQTLWDMLPGPVQWGLEHGAGAVGGLISGVGGLFGVGGDDDPEYSMADYGNPDSPAYTMVGGGGYDYGSQARGGGTTNINVYTSTNAEPSDITNSVVWGMQVAGVPT
jgi:TP901 family phage tail tape measure protein